MTRHLLSMNDLSLEEVLILTQWRAAASQKLEGTVGLLFQQPSLRTMSSFAAGAVMLGMTPVQVQTTGDKFRDQCDFDDEIVQLGKTSRMVAARKASPMNQDVVRQCERPVVNAGDGSNEHPTQALVDLTVMRRHGLLDGKRVVLMGNLRDHRVHHSLGLGLRMLGIEVTKVHPAELGLPERFDQAEWKDIETASAPEVDEILSTADFVYLTSCQFWSSPELRPGDAFSLNKDRADRTMKPGAKVMHPFPRFGELAKDLDGTRFDAYSEQAKEGPHTRYRVLAWLASQDEARCDEWGGGSPRKTPSLSEA